MLVSATADEPTYRLQLLTEENPPYSYRIKETGDIGGVVTTIVRELMARANIPYSLELQPWVRAFRTTLESPNTCVFLLDRTPERESKFLWISPMLTGRWHLFKRPDSPLSFNRFEDAKSYRIAGVRGFATAEWLESSGHEKTLLAASNVDALELLYRGRVDLWIAGSYEAPYVADLAGLPMPGSALGLHAVSSSMGCNLNTRPDIIEKLQHVNEGMADFRTEARKAAKAP